MKPVEPYMPVFYATAGWAKCEAGSDTIGCRAYASAGRVSSFTRQALPLFRAACAAASPARPDPQ